MSPDAGKSLTPLTNDASVADLVVRIPTALLWSSNHPVSYKNATKLARDTK